MVNYLNNCPKSGLQSGVPGHNLMYLKIPINLDKEEFENYQINDHLNRIEFEIESQEYIIFQCFFQKNAPIYTYDMFINICQNFLISDDKLTREIDELLYIIKNMYPSLQINLMNESDL